jgi:hypothetical protein
MPSKRPLASILYGVFDLIAAAFYMVLFTWFVPSRAWSFTALVWLLSALLAAGGVGMILDTRLGHRLAQVASVVMLAACLILILLLVSSAAYLHGIYDGVGQVGAAISLLAACLAVELVGLLPALQLAYLRRRRGG